MKFGLFLPTLTGWQRDVMDSDGGFGIRYERSYEICALAERVGFDFVTVGQHRFTPRGVDPSAPLTVLAALASRTKTLRLATNILILGVHDPVEIAEQVATIDEISAGRVILGVGLGYRSYEFEKIGLDYRKRVSRLEEGIEVLRRCWAAGRASFSGEHFHLSDAEVSPKPAQRPGPPIWVGAQSEAAMKRAARIGDGWLTDNVFSAEYMLPMIERYRAEAAAHGRPATIAMNRKVAIGHSREYVEQRWLPQILEFFRLYPSLGMAFEPDYTEKLMSGKPLGLADIPDTQIVAGTPEDCISALRRIESLTACEYIVVDIGDGAHGQQYEDLKTAIQLFGEDVIPAFR